MQAIVNAFRISPVAPAKLEQYARTYTSEDLDVTHTIRVEDGQAFVTRGSAAKQAMIVVTHDLTVDHQAIDFERDDAGQFVGFRLDVGRVKEIRFVRSA